MRRFNTTGVCVPEKHYMVDITERLIKIKAMIDEGAYFTINRARQYGKTTTLTALRRYIADDYTVVSLDFQGISAAGFATEEAFVREFCRLLNKQRARGLYIPGRYAEQLERYERNDGGAGKLGELFDLLNAWCREDTRGIVLMIDEVDSAANGQIFADFLAQLREGYISRDTDGVPTFQSVILAGVTDIKHLRDKIRDEVQHKVNSPWNIAVSFELDMDLPVSGIAAMLEEYRMDHRLEFDTEAIAEEIGAYTSGYPFLVSRVCQQIDSAWERMGFPTLSMAWCHNGVNEAVKAILLEKNTLFEALSGKLTNYPEMRGQLRRILLLGEQISYNQLQESIVQMEMYGFIRNRGGLVAISNRIFETLLYNLFLSDEEFRNDQFSDAGADRKNLFVTNGVLNMPLILEHFIKTYTEIFGISGERFRERDGRELFLLYLKPIINGTGNYYIEAQTRDQRRMDIVVDYLGKQYVIELKVWRGERYNESGERQITEYLEYFDLKEGYLLGFNFNQKKEQGVKRIQMGDKVLYEGIV